MLFLYEGPFFYFHCWVSSPISLHLKKQTLVWTVHWFLHICILHLLYYSMLTIIHEIYMLQVESNRWNLIFLCVASMPLLWIIALWVNSYARLIDACLESTIHEKSLLYDSFVYSLSSSLLRIAAFISYAYNSMIKIMIACHFRNYLCYRFTCSGRAGTKLGDADTSPTYR
mgnify:CR=1 FL=1